VNAAGDRHDELQHALVTGRFIVSGVPEAGMWRASAFSAQLGVNLGINACDQCIVLGVGHLAHPNDFFVVGHADIGKPYESHHVSVTFEVSMSDEIATDDSRTEGGRTHSLRQRCDLRSPNSICRRAAALVKVLHDPRSQIHVIHGFFLRKKRTNYEITVLADESRRIGRLLDS